MSAQPGGAGGSKPQPVAVEIPVTVNGASTIASNEKREPFSESTQTVLVFGSGAVIRLATAVAPGQLLFVTNEKSKKEVVCQVVKAKQNGGAGGYVELKFTEAAADFWGIRFPGSPAAPAPAVPTPVAQAPAPSAPVKPLAAKLPEAKNVAPSAPPLPPPAPKPVPNPVTVFPSSPASAAKSTLPDQEWKGTTMVATEEMPTRTKVPTLSEFLTQGSNGLELKAPDRPQLPPKPVPAAAELPLPSAAESSKPGLGVALGATLNSTAATATFDLAAEEVKIPSWLEPLARNSSSPVENRAEAASPESRELEASSDLSEANATLKSQDQKGVLTLSAEGRAPNFGLSLPLAGGAEQAKASGKGWKIALLILAPLLVAAAVWYWYISQPAKVSASGNSEAAGGLETIPAPAPAIGNTPSEPREANAANPAPLQNFEQPAALPSAAASVPRAEANGSRANHAEAPIEVRAEVQAKKPALGNVQLAAPVVTRSAHSQDNAASDPGLALSGAPNGDPGSVSLLGSKDKQPAAPLPVGGDVIPARLLSSVPPVYPQVARSERLSGDVVIDALIDQNGHVSGTKVISGPALLHQSAMEAVKKWKYQPATLNGQATAMHLLVTVQFRLQ